jgi:hypothetical protein
MGLQIDINKAQEKKEIVLKNDSIYIKSNFGEVGEDFELRITPLSGLQKDILIYGLQKDIKEKEDRELTNTDVGIALVKAQITDWKGITDADNKEIEFNEANLAVIATVQEFQEVLNMALVSKESYIIKKKNLEPKSKKK